jgi:hypothetical protein
LYFLEREIDKEGGYTRKIAVSRRKKVGVIGVDVRVIGKIRMEGWDI